MGETEESLDTVVSSEDSETKEVYKDPYLNYGNIDFVQDLAKNVLLGAGVYFVSDSVSKGVIVGLATTGADVYLKFVKHDLLKPLRQVYHLFKDVGLGLCVYKSFFNGEMSNNVNFNFNNKNIPEFLSNLIPTATIITSLGVRGIAKKIDNYFSDLKGLGEY